MGDLVSICINTYNAEKFITETLDSVLMQSYPHIELIITDDCSRDNTTEILLQYAQKYPNIDLKLNTENQGITKNVNQAVNRAKGKYCILLGHDDMLPRAHVAKILKGFKDNVGLVHCNAEIININGDRTGQFKRDDALQEQKTAQPLCALAQNNFIQSCGMIFLRALFLKTGGWEEKYRYYGEWLWYIKMLKHCDFAYSAQTRSMYRVHKNNITAKLKIHAAFSLLGYKIRCIVFAARANRETTGGTYIRAVQAIARLTAETIFGILKSLMQRYMPHV